MVLFFYFESSWVLQHSPKVLQVIKKIKVCDLFLPSSWGQVGREMQILTPRVYVYT